MKHSRAGICILLLVGVLASGAGCGTNATTVGLSLDKPTYKATYATSFEKIGVTCQVAFHVVPETAPPEFVRWKTPSSNANLPLVVASLTDNIDNGSKKPVKCSQFSFIVTLDNGMMIDGQSVAEARLGIAEPGSTGTGQSIFFPGDWKYPQDSMSPIAAPKYVRKVIVTFNDSHGRQTKTMKQTK